MTTAMANIRRKQVKYSHHQWRSGMYKDLDQIREMVNEDWKLLLRKAGERI